MIHLPSRVFNFKVIITWTNKKENIQTCTADNRYLSCWNIDLNSTVQIVWIILWVIRRCEVTLCWSFTAQISTAYIICENCKINNSKGYVLKVSRTKLVSVIVTF